MNQVPGLCLCLLLLASGIRSIPTVSQVRSAIERAQEINTLKRELNQMDERNLESPIVRLKTSRCPMMANFHGRRSSDNKEQDMRENDMLTAAKLLLHEGFTLQDLQTEQVRSEFSRQSNGFCQMSMNVACNSTEQNRRADGSCNNLQQPTWGMAGVAQRRVLEPAYEDGIESPRANSVLSDGGALPNPRLVSNAVHRGDAGREERSGTITLHAFQMGQFLDHDIISTPTQSENMDCCSSNTDTLNCLNINIERTDPFEPMFINNYCMEFPRSAPVFCSDALSGDLLVRRQQTNAITSYIDASNVYGSSDADMDELRETGTGFLKIEEGTRLPNNPDQTTCKANNAAGEFCSLAGDKRVNVVPSLTAYHNAFVLEHNRIAGLLQSAISDPDTLFQETRKIIIAIMQKIVYDEFLPSFLSTAMLNTFQLLSSAPYTYNPTIDATIANSFGIAFRFGHSWIPRDMSLFNDDLRPINMRFETDDTYNDPALTYITGDTSGMEGLAYWLSGQNSPETDRIVEEQARSRLFIDRANNVAFDLAALNIQRGRDHGLKSYTEFRVHCGLSSVKTWTDLIDHDADTIATFKIAGYRTPEDIDLYTGVLTETDVTGSTVGPTLECILADQFQRLKFGDRFWYQGSTAGFSEAQKGAIRDYSLSGLMCESYNFNIIHHPNAFKATDTRTRCRDIPALNVDVFKSATATTLATTRPPPPPPPPGNRRPLPGRTFKDILQELIHELDD